MTSLYIKEKCKTEICFMLSIFIWIFYSPKVVLNSKKTKFLAEFLVLTMIKFVVLYTLLLFINLLFKSVGMDLLVWIDFQNIGLNDIVMILFLNANLFVYVYIFIEKIARFDNN